MKTTMNRLKMQTLSSPRGITPAVGALGLNRRCGVGPLPEPAIRPVDRTFSAKQHGHRTEGSTDMKRMLLTQLAGLAFALGALLPTADAATMWKMTADTNVGSGTGSIAVQDELLNPGTLAPNAETGGYNVFYVDSDLGNTTKNLPLLDFNMGAYDITSTTQVQDTVIKIVANSITHDSGGGDIVVRTATTSYECNNLQIETTGLLKINSAVIYQVHYDNANLAFDLTSTGGSIEVGANTGTYAGYSLYSSNCNGTYLPRHAPPIDIKAAGSVTIAGKVETRTDDPAGGGNITISSPSGDKVGGTVSIGGSIRADYANLSIKAAGAINLATLDRSLVNNVTLESDTSVTINALLNTSGKISGSNFTGFTSVLSDVSYDPRTSDPALAGANYTINGGSYLLKTSADVRHWTGDTDTAWTTTGNWTGTGVPDGAGVQVSLGEVAGKGTVDLGSTSRTVGYLFLAPTQGTTLGGGGGGKLVLQNTSGAAITASGTHLISADVTLNSDTSVTTNPGPELSISGNIDGTASLVKAGQGTLILSGSNNYTGDTTINAGSLRLNTDAANMPANSIVKFNSGTLANGGVLAGNGTFNLNVGNSVGKVYWNNNGGFAAEGGNLDVTLNGGTQIPWDAAATGFNGKTLILGSLSATSRVRLTNNVNLTNASRTVYVLDNTGTTGDFTEISGIITNDATARGLTKDGPGLLVLSNSNTYTGVTTVTAGTLSVSNLQNAGVSSNLGTYATAGAAGISLNGGTLRYTGSSGVSVNRGFTLNNNSTIDVNPASTALTLGNCTFTPWVGKLTVTGGVGSSLSLGAVLLNGGDMGILDPTSADLSVASVSGNNLTLSGTTTGNTVGAITTGARTLTKSGASTWTLSGINNYTGNTTVSTGKLLLGQGGSMGATAVSVTGTATYGMSYTSSGTTVQGGKTLNLANGTTLDLRDGNTNTLNFTTTANPLSGAKMYFDLGTTTDKYDKLTLTGAATITNTNTLYFEATGGTIANGTYTIITAGSGLTGGTLTLGTTTLLGHTLSITSTPRTATAIYLDVTGGPAGYASWASANSITGDPSDDSNNDGVTNGVAYFMNKTGLATNPGIVGGSVTWTNGGNIPSSEYGADKQFVVQTSIDLQNWIVPTTGVVNQAGSVSYTLPTGEAKIFVRLKVTPN
jgi:fibronectin-binding autotransporter adhesin